MRWHKAISLVMVAVLSAPLAGCFESAQQDWAHRFEQLWAGYQKTFVSTQGRVIDRSFPDERSTSESQAYGMFIALVANDQTRFEQLLDWTRKNLAKGDLGNHLPAWLWGKRADGSWGVLDENTASDADLWMAYTLLQAGRLWDRPKYTETGRRMVSLIGQTEVLDVAGTGTVLLPGIQGFGPDRKGCVVLNPSYTPLPLAVYMAKQFGAPWDAIAEDLPKLIKDASTRGFTADWVEACPKDGIRIPASGRKPVGSYDAIRVYLWAGVTPADMPASKAVDSSLWGMTNFLLTHDAPPEKVDVLQGKTENAGPIGFSAALLPMLASEKMTKRFEKLASRVKKSQGDSGLIGSPARYYDQNLALFAFGYLGGLYEFENNGNLKVQWQ